MPEINHIIDKYFLGTISYEEETVLFDWIKQSEANELRFRELESNWEVSHEIGRADRLSLGRLKMSIDRSARKRRNRRKSYFITSVAAVLAAIVLFGVTKTALPAIKASSEKMITCAAPRGSKTFMTLEDGTNVWINAGSSISYSSKYNKKNRRIVLEGEAFFDVARNEKVPFVVEAGDCKCTVLGTKFNVSSYHEDNSIQVVLVNGSLKFDSSVSSDVMKPGDLYIFENNVLSKKVIDPKSYCSWLDGVIRYDDIYVPDFINRLCREFDVRITIRTDKFDKVSFKASFSHDQSVTSILEALCTIFPMKLNHVDDQNFFIDER